MDGDFDPEAFISGGDTQQPPALPTVTPSLSTFYYPSTPEDTRAQGLSYSMEGGIHGGGRFGDIDLRNHTLEQYLAGNSPFVAAAMKGEPTGNEFMTTILGHTVLARNVDTGGGLKDGQIDFATSNPDLARSGVEHGPFNPENFIKRQDISAPSVPDIHAFMEPAPADTPEEKQTQPEGNVGSAIGKAISSFGKALAQPRPIPHFQTPDIRQPFQIPQAGAQLPNMIPTAQPTPPAQPTPYQPQQFQPVAQPFPTPSVMPTPQGEQSQASPVVRNIPAAISELASGMMPSSFRQYVTSIFPPAEMAQQGAQMVQGLMSGDVSMVPFLGRVPDIISAEKTPPYSKERYVASAKVIQDLGMLSGGLHGEIPSPKIVVDSFLGQNILPRARQSGAIGATGGGREVPVPESFQPNAQTANSSVLTAKHSSKDLPFKPASVQGLKAGPAPPKFSQPASATQTAAQPPIPPQPPSGGEGAPVPQPPSPSYSKALNPAVDHGPFTRTYKIDKELGEMTDAVGAAKEAGNLVSEIAHRNMTFELSAQQEADVGKLLLSDRLKGVNPHHPQVIFDSVARGIEADPASKKALDYYRKVIEPDAEALHKRAGTSEASIAPGRGEYVPLIPKALPDGTIPELAAPGRLSMTTKFSKPAEGMAAEYSSNLREILRATYTEPMRKAAMRDLLEAAHHKGVLEKSSQFVPDPAKGPDAGKWVKTLDQDKLPEQMKHDLQLIKSQMSTVRPVGIERVLKSYQRGATAIQLGLNPIEMFNHMRRQLGIVAAKPPIGQGLMARLEAVVPYFGAKVGTLKRAMGDMGTPERVSKS